MKIIFTVCLGIDTEFIIEMDSDAEASKACRASDCKLHGKACGGAGQPVTVEHDVRMGADHVHGAESDAPFKLKHRNGFKESERHVCAAEKAAVFVIVILFAKNTCEILIEIYAHKHEAVADGKRHAHAGEGVCVIGIIEVSVERRFEHLGVECKSQFRAKCGVRRHKKAVHGGIKCFGGLFGLGLEFGHGVWHCQENAENGQQKTHKNARDCHGASFLYEMKRKVVSKNRMGCDDWNAWPRNEVASC